MLSRTVKSLTKTIKPTAIAAPALARSASRFTRSRRSPTSSSKTPSHFAKTSPRSPSEHSVIPPESSSTELSILGPPISRIPVNVPHDPQGVLDLTRGDWSTKCKELLSQPAIVVARQIEFMNIFLGFEQANKYQLLSPEGNLLGYLLEEEVGIGSTLKRQFLRTHRPFRATVLSPEGQVLLNIHRPFTFINSRIYVSTPAASETGTTAQDAKREMEQIERDGNHDNTNSSGQVIGEAGQVWNLIRRKYETFVKRDGEMVQFGNIDSGFLAWDFSVRDEQGRVIASINRNFTGFARELFADVGQYVIRFEGVVDELNPQLESPRTSGALPSPPSTTSSSLTKNSSVSSSPSSSESQSTSLTVPSAEETPSIPLDHRATLLATAVSIDFDFFSRHSGAGGMGGLGGFMPIPIPMGGYGSAGGEAGEAAEGAGGLGGEVAGIEREARRGEIGSGTPYGEGDGRTLPGSDDVMRDRENRWPNRDDGENSFGGFEQGGEEELMQDPWAQEEVDDGGTWGWNDLFGGDGDGGGE
ncbi:hypothetical protein JCM3765_004921 [Sporobolomyces pararoseus]